MIKAERQQKMLETNPAAARDGAEEHGFKEALGLSQIVGQHPLFLAEVRRLPRFARCDATVLIRGESGTGKEVFARAIHYLSRRAGNPFLPVNCGALSEALVESEIFGHKRGAFTGAMSDHPGLISQAAGGTLFLDEIDSLTLRAQVKLLRFLQEGEFRVVGSDRAVQADVRVVAAANADFENLMRDGRFREDLFYRLNILEMKLPPLRERRSDIPLLAGHMIEKQAAFLNLPSRKLSPAAIERLCHHSWPGNVRELQNVLTRALVLADHPEIEPSDLKVPDSTDKPEGSSFQDAKAHAVQAFERDFLEKALRAHAGNITHAARAVRKNRRAFWELLRKHDLLPSERGSHVDLPRRQRIRLAGW